MTDRKPPRLDAGEAETLRALLRYCRESVVRKVTGVADDDARRRLVGSETTLLWLVRHLAQAETLWVLQRFEGRDDPAPEPEDDSLAAAVDAYRATWSAVDAVLDGASSLDELCRALPAGEDRLPLRWVLAHLLEETARHAGHADILRELLDGQTGR